MFYINCSHYSHRKSNRKNLLAASYAIILVTLSACASRTTLGDWPSTLPARSLFIDAYYTQKKNGTNNNNLRNHLTWVKRFYLGSILYPLGWNRMTEILVDTLDETEQKERATQKMAALGVEICIEWAQDNSSRKIDSAAIAAWGEALTAAAEKDQQLAFIETVEQDVQALLTDGLDVKQISRDRYYPTQDYDNF